jgi:3-methyladenine DNA glycosylase/8-oxoguanine DNA glycosylase
MDDATCFVYGEKETSWLKKRDPVLGAVIDRIGPIRREVKPDLFGALVESIVGQQISSKAQKTICARIRSLCPSMAPEQIAGMSPEELQSCGISFRKVLYIREIAVAAQQGELNLEELRALPDEDICKRLSALKGVGAWTAEMLMIFSMQRPDVLSKDDLAIIRGLRMLYRHRRITPELFARYRRRYSPYGSVASFYLWAVAGGACPELVDPAPKKTVGRQSASKK